MAVNGGRKSGLLKAELIGVNELKDKFDTTDENTRAKMAAIIRTHSLAIQNDAKILAPVDMGLLRASIKARYYKNGLVSEIGTDTGYALFVEFGTGPAGRRGHPDGGPVPASYVHGSGGKMPPIDLILEWMKRKGIRPKGKQTPGSLRSLAFLIARKIGKHGMKARPFMFPAYEKNRPAFERDIQDLKKVF